MLVLCVINMRICLFLQRNIEIAILKNVKGMLMNLKNEKD